MTFHPDNGLRNARQGATYSLVQPSVWPDASVNVPGALDIPGLEVDRDSEDDGFDERWKDDDRNVNRGVQSHAI